MNNQKISKSRQFYIDNINKTQDDTLKSLERTTQMVYETSHLSKSTLEELRSQSIHIDDVNDQLDDIDHKQQTTTKLQQNFDILNFKLPSIFGYTQQLSNNISLNNANSSNNLTNTKSINVHESKNLNNRSSNHTHAKICSDKNNEKDQVIIDGVVSKDNLINSKIDVIGNVIDDLFLTSCHMKDEINKSNKKIDLMDSKMDKANLNSIRINARLNKQLKNT